MAFLTSWIFWAVLGAIILIIAIIGYLSDNSEDKKVTTNTAPQNTSVPEITTPTTPAPANSVAEGLWSDKAPKSDEKQETIHTVSSVDDWSQMPQITPTTPQNNEFITVPNNPSTEPVSTPETPVIQPELVQEIQPDINNESEEMFPDIKPSDLEPLPNDKKEADAVPTTPTTTAPPQAPVEITANPNPVPEIPVPSNLEAPVASAPSEPAPQASAPTESVWQ